MITAPPCARSQPEAKPSGRSSPPAPDRPGWLCAAPSALCHPFRRDQVRAGAALEETVQEPVSALLGCGNTSRIGNTAPGRKEHLLCQRQIRNIKILLYLFEMYSFPTNIISCSPKTCPKIPFQVIAMEIKSSKEVHPYFRECDLFGLSTQQFLCSALAVNAAVEFLYSCSKALWAQEASVGCASWQQPPHRWQAAFPSPTTA